MPSPAGETVGIDVGKQAVAQSARRRGQCARSRWPGPVGGVDWRRRREISAAGPTQSTGTRTGLRFVNTIRQTNDSQGGPRPTGRKGDDIPAAGRGAAVANAFAAIALPCKRRPPSKAAGLSDTRRLPAGIGRGASGATFAMALRIAATGATQLPPTGGNHHHRSEMHPRDAAAWMLAKRR